MTTIAPEPLRADILAIVVTTVFFYTSRFGGNAEFFYYTDILWANMN